MSRAVSVHPAAPHLKEYLQALAQMGPAEERERIHKAVSPAASTGNEDHEELAGFAGFREFRTEIERRLIPLQMGAVRLPFHIKSPMVDARPEGYWVPEGGAKPVGRFSATSITLPPRKVESLTVVTKRLLQTPEGGDVVLRMLGNAVVQTVNGTFASSSAAVAGTSPAGIGAGATGVAETMDVVADLEALVEAADDADVILEEAEWVMSPGRAVGIAGTIGSDTLGLGGGTLFGRPVHVDPRADTVYLTDPSRIGLAVGGITLETSTHASLELRDDPTADATTPTAAETVSLFQSNSIGFLVGIAISWEAIGRAVFALSSES